MITHFQYPPRLALIIDLASQQEAIVIEQRGLIQINLDGRVLFIAYRAMGIWIVEYPGCIKVVVPTSEVDALPPGG